MRYGAFFDKRGRTRALLRVVDYSEELLLKDGYGKEQVWKDGEWVDTGDPGWTGIGGGPNYEWITVDEAAEILRKFERRSNRRFRFPTLPRSSPS